MAIGVTYDEFWHGEANIVDYAIKTEKIRARRKLIEDDLNSWNTGRYVLLAVGVVMSQAFSKNSKAEYPAEPIIGTEIDERLAAQKRERELQKAHADFLAVAAALERRH